MTFRPAMLLTLFAAFFLSVATGVAQTSMSDNSPAAVDNPAGGDILDPGLIYAAKSPDQWVGKTVTLRNVAIQDTNNDGNFWVGRDGHHRLLIVKQDNNPNLTALHVRKGDVVTVTGTVQPASKYQSNVTSSSKGSMHDAEKSSGLFVMAESISISSANQH